jgi:alpha-L-fucosidase 2
MANAGKPYHQAIETHKEYYHQQFNRVRLDLGADRYSFKTTDQRIRDFATVGDDGWFAALYFQFGRYLLISCSQPGTQPANLQGIWNHKLNPAWSCRYTININTEMNYWPAEPTNLAEMHEPLVNMIKDLSETGRQSAKEMYGCRGWVAHHNTDLWRITGAVDYAWSGVWPTSNAWFCQHLWNRFAFNGDMDYLRKVYPLMKGAAEFFVDFLVTDPRTGYKVVCPSISPENHPHGRKASLYAGITMDNELVADLFTHTMQAAKLLNVDQAFADTISALRNQLTPLRIGQHGQLQEWAEDWDHPNDHHRHVSHLWALYPGNSISPFRTPTSFEAAKMSLIQRGDPSTGWSMGWKVCLWARCLDGDHAYRLIQNQLSLIPDTVERGANGGTYPNMFDAHPPFQIDGNFGCTAGIAEMLVQSHDGFVNLLPALPKTWPKGRLKGIRTVGGFIVEDMIWEDSRLKLVVVRSTLGGNLRIGTKEKAQSYSPVSSESPNPNPLFTVWSMPVEKDGQLLIGNSNNLLYLYDIETHKGETYQIKFD